MTASNAECRIMPNHLTLDVFVSLILPSHAA
jgi:hypothetical protein